MHLTIKKNTSEGYAQSEKPNRRSKQNVRAPALSTSTDSQRPLGSNIAQLIHTLCCITSKCSLEHIFHGYRNPRPYWKRKTPRRLSNTITYEHELRQICIPDWGFIHVTAAIAVFIRHYQNPLLVLSLNTHTRTATSDSPGAGGQGRTWRKTAYAVKNRVAADKTEKTATTEQLKTVFDVHLNK